jgi:hypothetical protein
MANLSGSEPIADDEILYRRIPVSQGWVDEAGVSPAAFRPHRNDTTGLSVYRAKYKPLETAAQGQSASGYYIAAFLARDARAYRIDIQPSPLADDPGHAEMPSLTYDLRSSEQAVEQQRVLARKVPLTIHGPFGAKPE